MTATLVLGGVRSGKSAFAQRAAEAASSNGKPTLVATGQAFDDEMGARIARHQAERGDAWETREAPLDLAGVLRDLDAAQVVVVDCLTLWLSNHLIAGNDMAAERQALVAAVEACPARIWLVSNEVGWGVVPESPLGREFRDQAGWLHQALAAVAERVVLVVAGLPLALKGGDL